MIQGDLRTELLAIGACSQQLADMDMTASPTIAAEPVRSRAWDRVYEEFSRLDEEAITDTVDLVAWSFLDWN